MNPWDAIKIILCVWAIASACANEPDDSAEGCLGLIWLGAACIGLYMTLTGLTLS